MRYVDTDDILYNNIYDLNCLYINNRGIYLYIQINISLSYSPNHQTMLQCTPNVHAHAPTTLPPYQVVYLYRREVI